MFIVRSGLIGLARNKNILLFKLLPLITRQVKAIPGLSKTNS